MMATIFRWLPVSMLCLGCAGPVDEPLGAGEQPVHDGTEAPRGFAFVLDARGPVVVLDHEPDPEWGVGTVEQRGPAEPGGFAVDRQQVDVGRVPPELADRAGRDVVLHGENGETCPARLGELELIGRSDRWELAEDMESPATRTVLAAPVLGIAGDCHAARWATLADEPEPITFRSRDDVEPRLADAALVALRALPAYQRIQSEYAVEHGDAWEHHDGARPRLTRFASGARTLVLVDAQAGTGCGDFGAALWGLFEARDGELSLRASAEHEPAPREIFDVDRDGRLELLSGERLLLPTADGVRSIDVEVPFYGCSC